MPAFIEATTEFSHQLHPVTPKPFSAAGNYLYLLVGCVGLWGFSHAGLHSGVFLTHEWFATQKREET